MPDSLSPRELAAAEVAGLVSILNAVPQTGIVPELVELGGHLERAVRAFHMEAIRFRAYTMRRLIKQHAAELPTEAPALMEGITAALETAGFHTKSVST
jgi:hypothetical protein